MNSSTLFVNGNKIPTLLAISDIEQQIGLMNRYELPPSMSFIYSSPKINKFWMKSTPCPLDIVFCCAGRVLEICKGEPYSTKMIGPNLPTDLVVEFPHGTCNRLGIGIGDQISIPELGPTNLFDKKYY